MMKRAVLVTMALVLSTSFLGAQTTSWRPTVIAQHGMVAAGHPLAAEAGMRILKAGGNAVDAAIATWAVQGQVEPGSAPTCSC
jgi:gamma-glutamyltranspeptidase